MGTRSGETGRRRATDAHVNGLPGASPPTQSPSKPKDRQCVLQAEGRRLGESRYGSWRKSTSGDARYETRQASQDKWWVSCLDLTLHSEVASQSLARRGGGDGRMGKRCQGSGVGDGCAAGGVRRSGECFGRHPLRNQTCVLQRGRSPGLASSTPLPVVERKRHKMRLRSGNFAPCRARRSITSAAAPSTKGEHGQTWWRAEP